MKLLADLGCTACHTGLPIPTNIRARAPSLADAGRRLSAARIFTILGERPIALSGTGRARMPAFHFDDRERLALTLYLSEQRATGSTVTTPTAPFPSRSPSKAPPANADRAPPQSVLERLRRDNRGITVATGRRLFVALNCAGCHDIPGVSPWFNAPDLSAEGSRVTSAWLRAFLRSPHAVRPFGAYPGTGGRMPDFALSSGEADSIAAYLGTRRAAMPLFTPRPLTPFARAKAEALLRDQLPCLGCHQLNGQGGRIAPDLSLAASRLRPEFVAAIIHDPGRAVPGTIMPRTAMPRATLDLIISYVAMRRTGDANNDAPPPPLPPPPHGADDARGATSRTVGYLSLIDNPNTVQSIGSGSSNPSGESSGQLLYARACAPCHGAAGRGDGWNTRFLPTPPTAHASAQYMATRTNGALYDGIHAGGRILNRSNRMPAFGHTLNRAQIRSLVVYIRELCRCQGPAWSLDGE